MMYYETKFPVRYYETDQMGIVHHSNYIRYFECSRSAMMDEGGYSVPQCEADGVTLPIVSVSCKYKYPARMGDILTVTCSIEKVPLAKLIVKQEVYNQDGKLCVMGDVVIGFLNKETGKPTRCPEQLAAMIESRLGDRPDPMK